MAFRANVSLNYATHLPALMTAMSRTTGAVLELGMGLFSTPYLHYACMLAGRTLVSIENDASWAQKFIDAGYGQGDHVIHIVLHWDAILFDRDVWDVVLIDHSPSERRMVDIKRLADRARYIVIHDANGRHESTYHYSTIYPLFKYRAVWDRDSRHAAVLSNFVDLADFWTVKELA